MYNGEKEPWGSSYYEFVAGFKNGVTVIEAGEFNTSYAILPELNGGIRDKNGRSVLQKAHVELIVDAGNTASKTDLLPSELLAQRDALLEALIQARTVIRLNRIGQEIPISQLSWANYQNTPSMQKINAAIAMVRVGLLDEEVDNG